MTKLCHLWLTCADKKEADKISEVLLKKRLVTCVRQMPVSSAYWWKGKIEKSEEVLLMMESRENLFDQIEREVAKLHSYETPSLTATPVSQISASAKKWLNEGFKNAT